MGTGRFGRIFGVTAFLLAGLSLCLLFLLIYPQGDLCRLFQYALVLLCLLFAYIFRARSAEGILSLLALLFTAGADFFLVALREEQRLLGMAIFCFAQLFWAARLFWMERGRRRAVHLLFFAPLCALLLVVAVILGRGKDGVLLFSAVYAALLVSTVIFAWATPRNLLFTLGMTLFFGCDFFVMVNNAALYLDLAAHPLLKALYEIPFNMMWAFYGPSQMLLALSSAVDRP